MEYYYRTFFLLLTITTTWEEATSILTRTEQVASSSSVRNFRRHINSIPRQIDWELGLREATNQALLRERYNRDRNLREHLLEAPLHGRHDTATPFGDIAILARGQLYVQPEGYQFVQDSTQNANDYDNNNRWNSQQDDNDNRQLLALWTVKRIRHRDQTYGHIYELEYTISTINKVISESFVRRNNGRFDYTVPGHVFVIKTDPRLLNNNNQEYYNKWHIKMNPAVNNLEEGSTNHPKHYTPQSPPSNEHHFKPGILIGVDANGYKHFLHSYPGFYTSYHQQTYDQKHHSSSTIDPKEYELYQQLLESLALKTAPPSSSSYHHNINNFEQQHIPHRFSFSTSEQARRTTPTTFVNNKPTTQTITTTKLHNLPTTTSNIKSPETLHIITPSVYVPTTTTTRYTSTPIIIPTQSTNYYPIPSSSSSTPQSTVVSSTTNKFTSSSSSKIPMTIYYYTPAEEEDEMTTRKSTTEITLSTKKQRPNHLQITTSTQQQYGFVPTKAETLDNFDLFFNNIPTQPMTSSTRSTTTTAELRKTTTPVLLSQDTTTTNFVNNSDKVSKTTTTNRMKTNRRKMTTKSSQNTKTSPSVITEEYYTKENLQQSDRITTKTIEPVTQEPPPSHIIQQSYPTTAINEQLSSPSDRNTDTTIPYNIIHNKSSSTSTSVTTEETVLLSSSTSLSTSEEARTTIQPASTIITKNFTLNNNNNAMTTEGTKFTIIVPSTQMTTFEPSTTDSIDLPTTFTTHIYNPPSTTKPLSTSNFVSTINDDDKIATTSTLLFNSKQPENEEESITTTTMIKQPTTTSLFDSTFNDETIISTQNDFTIGTTVPLMTTESVIMTTTNDDQTTDIRQSTIESTAKSTTKTTPTTEMHVDDFLLADADDNNNNKETDHSSSIIMNHDNNDDIFGLDNNKKQPNITEMKISQPIVQSEFAGELFGKSKRKTKQLNKYYEPTLLATTTNQPKIIYSNFYVAAATTPSSSSTEMPDTTTIISDHEIIYETTTINNNNNIDTLTDQSYSTSISFEVNKRNNNNTQNVLENILVIEPTILSAKLSEIIDNSGNYNIYKAEHPSPSVLNRKNHNKQAETTTITNTSSITTTTEDNNKDMESKKEFDNLALQLVNHARSIDYLSKKPKTTKYKRRRNYRPKTKKQPQRAK